MTQETRQKLAKLEEKQDSLKEKLTDINYVIEGVKNRARVTIEVLISPDVSYYYSPYRDSILLFLKQEKAMIKERLKEIDIEIEKL